MDSSVDRNEQHRSLLRRALDVTERVAFTGVSAVVGGLFGAVSFNAVRSGRARDENLPEEERLMGDVRFYQTLRMGVGMMVPWLETQEYIARKKLEEMGYLPCEVCGVPHKSEEHHEMPPGTYWHDEYGFIRPEDERWSVEAYEAADDRWEMDADSSDDDEPMH